RDGFVVMAKLISASIDLDKRSGAPSVYQQISRSGNEPLKASLSKQLLELLRWVPYRFIRPFFSNELNGLGDGHVNARIKKSTGEKPGHAPYCFEKGHIVLDDRWAAYFRQHHYILLGFTQWHLLRFLQRNNPNVIGLSEKLAAPMMRKLSEARTLWSSFLQAAPIECIYSGELLDGSSISLDHFIPWSYLVHDQLWNIVPTTPQLNSRKGDALPDLAGSLDGFLRLQFQFFNHFRSRKASLLEDYHQLLKTDELDSVSEERFGELLFLEISTHHRSALAMGFSRTFSIA
ncbi:MAG: hypothetical protein EOO09_22485, partial [Chitinophagaceae bacterium]